MALLLSEDHIHQVFADFRPAELAANVTDCIERAFLEQHIGNVSLHQRVHIDFPKGRGYLDGTVIRILPGMLPGLGERDFAPMQTIMGAVGCLQQIVIGK